jgi:hypothetical protein
MPAEFDGEGGATSKKMAARGAEGLPGGFRRAESVAQSSGEPSRKVQRVGGRSAWPCTKSK